MNLDNQLKQFDMDPNNILKLKLKNLSEYAIDLLKRVRDPLMHAHEVLKKGELSLRERWNIYAGTVGGAIGSVAAARYLFFNSGPDELYSLIALPIGLEIGAYLGNRSARRMRNAREERKRSEAGLEGFVTDVY